MTAYAIIYRIVNTVNGKSYIGKTKSVYGEKTEYGLKGRWSQHVANSKMPSRQNECPLFYNALRKYGSENFKAETLLHCNLTDMDFYETQMISLYDSTNKNFGYNIAKGGRGRSVVEISNEIRQKISKSQRAEGDSMNIKPLFKDKKLVGYRVRRREKGAVFQKEFGNQKNTVEENLRLAQECLACIEKGTFVSNRYNRKEALPTNISYYKENGQNIGYIVTVMKNNKKSHKTICSKSLSMEEKLQQAIEYKKQFMEQQA